MKKLVCWILLVSPFYVFGIEISNELFVEEGAEEAPADLLEDMPPENARRAPVIQTKQKKEKLIITRKSFLSSVAAKTNEDEQLETTAVLDQKSQRDDRKPAGEEEGGSLQSLDYGDYKLYWHKEPSR